MATLSFERDIKPLFTERDRAEMEWALTRDAVIGRFGVWIDRGRPT